MRLDFAIPDLSSSLPNLKKYNNQIPSYALSIYDNQFLLFHYSISLHIYTHWSRSWSTYQWVISWYKYNTTKHHRLDWMPVDFAGNIWLLHVSTRPPEPINVEFWFDMRFCLLHYHWQWGIIKNGKTTKKKKKMELNCSSLAALKIWTYLSE